MGLSGNCIDNMTPPLRTQGCWSACLSVVPTHTHILTYMAPQTQVSWCALRVTMRTNLGVDSWVTLT